MDELPINVSDHLATGGLPPALAGADLRGRDLSCLDGITAEQLRGAILDKTTMMPPGLEHLVRDVPAWTYPIR